MNPTFPEIAVAGHICVDIIPGGRGVPGPGEVCTAGPATVSTGGVVSNTGIALHHLGVPVRLMGKTGDDLLGRLLCDVLRDHGPELVEGMAVSLGGATSYSIVISPPAGDRGFLHCPGVNDTFNADDVDFSQLSETVLFHFGYPPLMRQMFLEGGTQTEMLYRRAKELGMTTGLDMACPDAQSEAGQNDWRAFLKRILPHVDLFTPSLDDLAALYGADVSKDCETLAGELLEMGPAAVLLKLGDDGLYLRSSGDAARWSSAGRATPTALAPWLGRSLYVPCYQVNVAGTTGAGDVTGAGFLAAFVLGMPPEACVASATAVGAHGVEAPDATGGVPTWTEVNARMASDWTRHPAATAFASWRQDSKTGVRFGPADAHR